MARMATMESCPKCGAALAANLVKLLKTDPENYTCPGGSTDSRKDWESKWGEDVAINLDEDGAKYLAWATNKENN